MFTSMQRHYPGGPRAHAPYYGVLCHLELYIVLFGRRSSLAGIAFAHASVMVIASIDVWSAPLEDRSCRVIVYENACQLVLEARGQRVWMFDCPSVAAAMDTAAVWRESTSSDAHAA